MDRVCQRHRAGGDFDDFDFGETPPEIGVEPILVFEGLLVRKQHAFIGHSDNVIVKCPGGNGFGGLLDEQRFLDAMMAQFAERARRDSIPLMLAVAYEEQRNFVKAIEVLLKVREYDPRKSFFDEKIRSLKERQAQQPGARGFRK